MVKKLLRNIKKDTKCSLKSEKKQVKAIGKYSGKLLRRLKK
jgi:hypothetical protein